MEAYISIRVNDGNKIQVQGQCNLKKMVKKIASNCFAFNNVSVLLYYEFDMIFIWVCQVNKRKIEF